MAHILFWFYLKLPIVSSVSTDSGPTSMKTSGRTVLGFTPPPVMLRFLTSRNCLCFCWGEISTSPGHGSSQLTNPIYTLFNSRYLLYLLPVMLLWWDSHLSWFPFYLICFLAPWSEPSQLASVVPLFGLLTEIFPTIAHDFIYHPNTQGSQMYHL